MRTTRARDLTSAAAAGRSFREAPAPSIRREMRPLAVLLILLLLCSYATQASAKRASDAGREPYCRSGGAPGPGLVDLVESELGPSPVAGIGPAAKSLADELLERLCSNATVREQLPNVCSAGASRPDVRHLRAELLRDVLRAPRGAAQRRLAQLPLEERASLALLASLDGTFEPAEVAHRLALGVGLARGAECAVPSGSVDTSLDLGVLLFWHVSQPVRTPDRAEVESRVREILETAGNAGVAAPRMNQVNQVTQRIERLITRAGAMHEAWSALRRAPESSAHAKTLWRSELETLEAALTLAEGSAIELPKELSDAVLALVEGNPDAALNHLEAWLVSRARVSESLLAAARTLLGFAAAETRARAERIVRGRLFGLPAWTDGIILSANAGVPSFSMDELSLVGEAAVGYDSRRFGGLAHGQASLYSLDVPATSQSETLLVGGSLDLWFGVPVHRNVMLEFAGTTSLSLFDTETLVFATGSLYGEDSLLARGGGLVGARLRLPRARFGLWAGGSAQLESFGLTTIEIGADGSASGQIADQDTLGGMAELRALARYELWSDVLGLHVTFRGKYYTLTRVATELTIADANFTQIDERSRQIEATGRAFIDLEALRFFELVPGLGLGVDHYALAIEGQPTQTTTVPIYSVGIQRRLD